MQSWSNSEGNIIISQPLYHIVLQTKQFSKAIICNSLVKKDSAFRNIGIRSFRFTAISSFQV